MYAYNTKEKRRLVLYTILENIVTSKYILGRVSSFMKNIQILLLLYVVLIISISDALAEDSKKSINKYLEDNRYTSIDWNKKITTKYIDKDIRIVIDSIMKEVGLDVMLSSDVVGNVTLDLNDITIKDALEQTLNQNGYGWIYKRHERGIFIGLPKYQIKDKKGNFLSTNQIENIKKHDLLTQYLDLRHKQRVNEMQMRNKVNEDITENVIAKYTLSEDKLKSFRQTDKSRLENLKVIDKKKLPENIESILLSPRDTTRDSFYLSGIVNKNKVQYLDTKGNIKNTEVIADGRAIFPIYTNEFYALLKYKPQKKAGEDWKGEKYDFIFKSKDGKLLIKHENISIFNDYQISPEGNIIWKQEGEEMGALLFDKLGNLIWKGFAERIEFSRDEKYFAVIIRNEVIYLNNEGKEIWKKKLGAASRISISESGNYVCVVGGEDINKYVCVINRAGEIIWKEKLPLGGIDCAITPNGKYLLVYNYMIDSSKHALYFYDIVTGDIMWSYIISNSEDMYYCGSDYRAIDFSLDSEYILIYYQSKDNNFISFIFDKDGDFINKLNLGVPEQFEPSVRQVRIYFLNEDRFIVQKNNEIITYEIPKE